MISKVKPKNILAVDFKKCTLTDNGNRAKICRTIILLYCKQTMHQPPFNVFRMCLKVTLLSFRHRTLCNLIMVGWAKNHHIFGPKMRIICPLYNVMILKKSDCHKHSNRIQLLAAIDEQPLQVCYGP